MSQAELPLSPHLRDMRPYPFSRLDQLRKEKEKQGMDMIDLSIGDLREPTPTEVREALVEASAKPSQYPRVLGQDELRGVIAQWIENRFQVTTSPDRHILPTNGSKEVLFNLPLAVVDREKRPTVMVPDPAYPVYARGIDAVGAKMYSVVLEESLGFLPNLDKIPSEVWNETSILWVNYPNNPTGATAPGSFFEEAVSLCREHGVLLASDEAYTEIYFKEPPVSALQFGLENVIALHTLSKRSAMPGYRSGFIAGDPRLMDALKRFRPAVGVATPDFIQAAAMEAWRDEFHVQAIRNRFEERRQLMIPALTEMGYEVTPCPATIYLWIKVPTGVSSDDFMLQAMEEGLVILPGTAMGSGGEGFFRLSLTYGPDRLQDSLPRFKRLLAS